MGPLSLMTPMDRNETYEPDGPNEHHNYYEPHDPYEPYEPARCMRLKSP